MDDLGQFGPISVLPEKELTGTFSLRTIKRLDKSDQPCESDNQYSYSDCMMNYVTRTTNCSINIISNNFNCTYEGLNKLFHTLSELKISTRRNITEKTGCLPKCITNYYKFLLSDEEDAIWRKDWISSFYLSTTATSYYTFVENYSYDEQVDGQIESWFIDN